MRALSRRAFLAGSLGLAVATLAACGQAGAPPAPKPGASGTASPTPATSPSPSTQAAAAAVKAVYVGLTANQMLWPLALEAGYFDKYGVKVDLQYIQGGPVASSGLASGSVDMLTSGGQLVVGGLASKQDMIMVAGLQNEVVSVVVGSAGINSIDDVRGKTVAVTKVGQADYFDWVTIAQKRGWKVEDFKFVAANDQQGQVQLLGSGNAQAISIAPPLEVSAQRAGGHVILDLAQQHIPLQLIGAVTSKSWLAKGRPQAIAVIKATIEAINRWKTDAAFTKNVIKKYLKEEDQAFVDSAYSHFVPVWAKTPYPSKEGFQAQVNQVSAINPAAKDVKVDDCMDLSLVKDIEDSGFIKQVYGS